MRLWGIAIGIGATACGGAVTGDVPPDGGSVAAFPAKDFQSGARLRAQTYRTSEGLAVFHGWFDSELGVACAFARAEDGVLRCLPTASAYDVIFADASCTTAIGVQDRSVVEPTGPRYATAVSCDGARVFLGGDAAAAPLAKAYTVVNDACGATGFDFPTFAVVQHVDASAFVAGTWITKEVDGALAARVLVADDGARATMSAYDLGHADACDLGDPTVNATSICAPLLEGVPDPQCAASDVTTSCANALPSAMRVSHGCAAGAATAVALSQSCFPGERVTVVAGEAFDPPHLAYADQGSGRLRVRWVTSAGGEPIRAPGFYDSVLDTPCHGGFAGGTRRCVPDAWNLSEQQGVFIGGCWSDTEPAITANGCVVPAFAFFKGQYYARAAPLEAGAQVCREGETCLCSTYDGSGGTYHSTPLANDAFEPLDDVTE